LLDKYKNQRIVETDNQEGFSGKLHWGDNELIHIELEDYCLEEGSKDSIEWSCKNGRKITTLNNDIYNSCIYPTYLLEGHDLPDKYNGFAVRLSNVSQWLLRWSGFDISNNVLTKKIPGEVFSLSVTKSDLVSLKISTPFQFETRRSKTNKDVTEIEEFYYLDIAYDKPQSIEYILEESQSIRRLFSFILGSPLNIEALVLKTPDKKIPIIFNDFKVREMIRSSVDVIIDASHLKSRDGWEKLFQSFYSSNQHKRFKGIWSKFFGVMAHEGFWEHGIFSCVSLLEAYCSIHCRNCDDPLPEEVFASIVELYKDLIDKHKSIYESHSMEIFDGLKGLLGKSRNTKYPTFNMKFDKLISDTPNEIVESIGITKDDFRHIKDIRDSVAHGGTPKTNNHLEITYEITIKNKIMVLILYYIYTDLGFDKEDFISFISRRFNKILRSAQLNNEKIARYSGNINFYEVSKASFEKAKHTNGHKLVFRYDTNSDSLIFDDFFTEKVKKWPGESKTQSNLEQFLFDTVSQTMKCETIGYLNRLYVTHGQESKELWGVCLIDPPDGLYELTRSYP
jgi:hypothetical protein